MVFIVIEVESERFIIFSVCDFYKRSKNVTFVTWLINVKISTTKVAFTSYYNRYGSPLQCSYL